MIDYKNLTNEELLEIIDSGDTGKQFKEIKLLCQADSEFRSRIVDLKVQNKQDQKENESSLIEVLEKCILEAPEEVKPKIQELLDSYKKIFDRK